MSAPISDHTHSDEQLADHLVELAQLIVAVERGLIDAEELRHRRKYELARFSHLEQNRVLVANDPQNIATWESRARVENEGLVEALNEALEAARASGGRNGRVPTDQSTPAGRRPDFFNYVLVPGEGEGDRPRRIPIGQPELVAEVHALTGGWPKLVGDALFALNDRGEPRTLNSPDQLFAWLGADINVSWGGGAGFVSQGRFFEALKLSAERFETVERFPHFPPVPVAFYACDPVPPDGDGAALERLLDFPCYATPGDRELLRAFALTLFWGGPPGKRPNFIYTGPDNDPSGGRGVGKTEVPTVVASLVGGAFSNVSARDEIASITKRIINDRSRKRCLLLDNVKTERFSWGDYEALITGESIGGHQLYVGDQHRPNLMTFAMTINGGSFSEDMAQRSVVIKLGRPRSYDVDGSAWSDAVRDFVTANQGAILADIAAAFARPAAEIEARSRWASWEHAVLARCNDPAALQGLIAHRQAEVNDDRATQDDFGSFLAGKLERNARIRDAFGHPDAAVAWIATDVLVPLVAEFTGENVSLLNSSKKLRRICPPELTKDDRRGGRGWRWLGRQADPTQAEVELVRRDDLPSGAARPW